MTLIRIFAIFAMNMSRLVEHIEYLIERNDCVVIPRVGAIIKRYVPAVYAADGSLLPPHHEFSFNEAVKYDDGLLASSLARREGCGYSEAAAILDSEVDVMRFQLERDGVYSLGFLGKLIHNPEGHVLFEPSDVAYYNKLVFEIPETPVRDITEDERPPAVYLHLSRFTTVASKIAAIVALALILGFCVYRPMPMGEGVMKASLLPQLRGNISVSVAEITPDVTMTDSDATPADELLAPGVHDAEISEDSAPVVNPDVKTIEEDETDYTYYLIVASLASIDLANQFIAEEGDAEFTVIPADGRYRVAAKGGMSYREVYDADLLARFPDAWVYNKR